MTTPPPSKARLAGAPSAPPDGTPAGRAAPGLGQPPPGGRPAAAAPSRAGRRAFAALGLLLAAGCGGAGTDTADATAWWSPAAEATAGVPATPGAGGAGAVGGDGAGAASAGAVPPATAAPAGQPPLAPDDEPAPPLAAAGSAPEQVWRQLSARHTWLYRHPDPAGLDLLYAAPCTCLADERELLAGLTAQGRWWTGARPELTAVEVRDDAAPDLVALRATYARRGAAQLVDASGAVHQTVPARDPIVIDVVLVREDASAPWLVRALSEQGSAPGATP